MPSHLRDLALDCSGRYRCFFFFSHENQHGSSLHLCSLEGADLVLACLIFFRREMRTSLHIAHLLWIHCRSSLWHVKGHDKATTAPLTGQLQHQTPAVMKWCVWANDSIWLSCGVIQELGLGLFACDRMQRRTTHPTVKFVKLLAIVSTCIINCIPTMFTTNQTARNGAQGSTCICMIGGILRLSQALGF